MKIKIAFIFSVLIGAESSTYANIPRAVSTKYLSACEMQANGNPEPITACVEQEIWLIEEYIKYNLNYAPASKKKEWQQFQKKISEKCHIKNNNPSDSFNNFGYTTCIRNKYSKFNRKLLNIKE